MSYIYTIYYIYYSFLCREKEREKKNDIHTYKKYLNTEKNTHTYIYILE